MRSTSIIDNSLEQEVQLALQWEAGERWVFASRGSTTMVVIACIPVFFSSFIGGLGDGYLPIQKSAAPLVEI